MIFNEGDTVKVVKPTKFHTDIKGKTGTVLSVNAASHSCRVDLEWDAPEGSGFEKQGVLGTYLFSELELVKAVDQEEQIFKIAAALHTEGDYADVPWAEIKEIAKRLYRVGVRNTGVISNG